MIKSINARVISNQRVRNNYYLMKFSCRPILDNTRPGQFIHLKLNPQSSGIPLLRRPFSIYNISKSNNRRYTGLEILYKIAGQGTKLMSELSPKTDLNLLGPLGNGYKLTRRAKYSILVAGGIGVAGLHLLLKELTQNIRRNKCERQVYLFIGARTKTDLYVPSTVSISKVKVKVSTEDGSSGQRGYVTQLLKETIAKIPYQAWSEIQVYACGPYEMSREVAEITVPLNIPCQISLETHMGCGLGFCHGCAVRIQDGSGKRYAAVCSEGPVFEARQIYYQKEARV